MTRRYRGQMTAHPPRRNKLWEKRSTVESQFNNLSKESYNLTHKWDDNKGSFGGYVHRTNLSKRERKRVAEIKHKMVKLTRQSHHLQSQIIRSQFGADQGRKVGRRHEKKLRSKQKGVVSWLRGY